MMIWKRRWLSWESKKSYVFQIRFFIHCRCASVVGYTSVSHFPSSMLPFGLLLNLGPSCYDSRVILHELGTDCRYRNFLQLTIEEFIYLTMKLSSFCFARQQMI